MRAWVVAVALMLSACHDPMSPAESALASAESRWNASRPASNSYVFWQSRACFCIIGGVSHEVTVVNGTLASVKNLATGAVLPADQFGLFRTVAQLFGDLRAAIKSPGVLQAAEYDTTIGYPTVVSLDPIKNAIDDEISYRSSHFVPSG